MSEILNMIWDDDDFEEEMEVLISTLDDSISSNTSSSTSDTDSSISGEEYEDFIKKIDKFNVHEFKSHMRINASTTKYLIDGFSTSSYNPDNCNGGRQSVSPKKAVYMYIWYVGNTITFRQLSILFNVSKSTAWLVVKRVSSWLVSIGHEHIKWPQGTEITKIQKKFEEKKKIPGVLGAIDCTHITIKAPKNNRECYFDRKQNYSIVLQAVVDPNKKFLDISCGEPGSLHDFRVLRRSELYLRAESNLEQFFPNNAFILGDSAYPPNRWIVPPFKDYGNLSETQKKFNKIHSSTRITVENAFGLLKTRFRRTLKFTEQTNLLNITNLVTSMCILHNICISLDDLHEFIENELYANDDDSNSSNLEIGEGSSRRDVLYNLLIERNII
ncbi:protein ALP1-like [Lucilia cuprina]|uniref:protein ALP1-like n=1 Tax=Lucilia cuprina TaxID=7375 RepID=UPI001F050666|nr:protein ALP1-like [Lucilia cuprina]XP_046802347.1 protein ALP1-like [Lucilia cuprina]XP_046802348.1 protein ALP1-like [Lucilia cuprina]